MEYHQDLPVLFTQMSVASLRAEWIKADAAYRAGSPLMSDQDFDQLEAQLRSVAPYAPELQGPGGGSALLSLNHEIFYDWRDRLPVDTAFVVEPKIDGCAVALRYVKGRLADAWTRSGRSAMPAIDLVKSVPRRIKASGTVQVNGELYGVGIEKSQQDAAKSLNKTPDGNGLAFMAYTLVDAQGDELASLQAMSKWGFIVPDALVCTRDSEVMALHRRWEKGDLFQSLPTDGIVVKVLSHDQQQELGITPKYPCWALAMKK